MQHRIRTASPEEVAVLCDFDGTISVRDVQVLLLDRFARSDWREAEKQILAEGRKSKHYLPAIWAECRGTAEEFADYIDNNAQIDVAFGRFVTICREQGWVIEVVSDGLSIYIERLLAREGLLLPFYSNRINFLDSGLCELGFPNHNYECGKCGSCKQSRVKAVRDAGAKFVIYVGDGISDECVASTVDLLYAKDSLERFCQREGHPYVPYHDFSDVISSLSMLLGNT